MRRVLGSSIDNINNSCISLLSELLETLKGLSVSKFLLSDVLDPIIALVFSWQKMELNCGLLYLMKFKHDLTLMLARYQPILMTDVLINCLNALSKLLHYIRLLILQPHAFTI
ncbi:hypothetical protein Hdeb2414_s1014g00973121 [Helianthus debilis subsp. tardiflorus]